MKKQLSDEQIDHLMRTLLKEADPGENVVNGIADSPKLWWGVQRNIIKRKSEGRLPWMPLVVRRIFLFATPAVVAAGLIISFFILPPVKTNNGMVQSSLPEVAISPADVIGSRPEQPVSFEPGILANSVITTGATAKPLRAIARSTSRPAVKGSTIAKVEKPPVYKTEFIALSYAGTADSGQIIRVRVPSSMMVSLGLVSSVNRLSDLVDAEVIVGDDGLTRAIRFIR